MLIHILECARRLHSLGHQASTCSCFEMVVPSVLGLCHVAVPRMLLLLPSWRLLMAVDSLMTVLLPAQQPTPVGSITTAGLDMLLSLGRNHPLPSGISLVPCSNMSASGHGCRSAKIRTSIMMSQDRQVLALTGQM